MHYKIEKSGFFSVFLLKKCNYSHTHFLSPDELVHKYRQIELLGWNASKIGVFFSAHLLIGNWNRNRNANRAFINEF